MVLPVFSSSLRSVGHDAGAGLTERVAERDRAAFNVQLVSADAEMLGRGDYLCREGFVDLDEFPARYS